MQEVMLMELLKVMDNILGMMEVNIKEILKMGSDMAMVYGRDIHKFQKGKKIHQIKEQKINNLILDNIEWIKKKALVYMNGLLMDTFIKVNLKTILEMDTDKCIIKINVVNGNQFIKEDG